MFALPAKESGTWCLFKTPRPVIQLASVLGENHANIPCAVQVPILDVGRALCQVHAFKSSALSMSHLGGGGVQVALHFATSIHVHCRCAHGCCVC